MAAYWVDILAVGFFVWNREARMVDMQVMASLQNRTAFFAATSLLAVGGALALLRSTNDAWPFLVRGRSISRPPRRFA
jgi:uncharacterized membrane protein